MSYGGVKWLLYRVITITKFCLSTVGQLFSGVSATVISQKKFLHILVFPFYWTITVEPVLYDPLTYVTTYFGTYLFYKMLNL